MNLKKEMDIICAEIKSDPGYRQAWKANIAMAILDTYSEDIGFGVDDEYGRMHLMANKAAERFLNLLTMDSSNE